MATEPKRDKALRSRLFGWWYVTIGAGFLLLAVAQMVVAGRPWLIALRVVISAGFLWLGYFELHKKDRR